MLVFDGDPKPERLGNSHYMLTQGQQGTVSMGTKLYVGNLSFDTTENELSDLFGQFGAVTSCNVITDKFTNKSRGFAFVEMSNPAEAAKAIAGMNGKDCGGRALTVNEARPREERSGGGGGYGGGGGGGGGGRRNRY
jgi:cold-inducible RNA-binding protein